MRRICVTNRVHNTVIRDDQTLEDAHTEVTSVRDGMDHYPKLQDLLKRGLGHCNLNPPAGAISSLDTGSLRGHF